MLILRNTVHNLNVVFLTCKACNEVSSSIRNLLDMDSFFRMAATPHFKDITGEKTSPFLLFKKREVIQMVPRAFRVGHLFIAFLQFKAACDALALLKAARAAP